MPTVFKTVINMSVWILFIKGLLIAFATIYTIGDAYLAGDTTPMVGVAACAAGSFAFILACIAAWLRIKVE